MSKLSKTMFVAQPGPISHCPQTQTQCNVFISHYTDCVPSDIFFLIQPLTSSRNNF